jgi:desulfoferrodoxin-like iron-binding protein
LRWRITTKLDEIYVCKTCGNKVKVIGTGEGKLVCCGKPMTLASA